MADQQAGTAPVEPSLPLQTDRKKHDGTSQPPRWLWAVMTFILVILALGFFVGTFVQLWYLNSNIFQVSPVQLSVAKAPVSADCVANSEQQVAARHQEYLEFLEAYVVTQRHHEAAIGLGSSLWLKYLGFLTGMILALVGASFILGRLTDPVTQGSAQAGSVTVSLTSASPGIILAVLGVILMYATINHQDNVSLTDVPIYLGSVSAVSTPMLPPPPVLNTPSTNAPTLRPPSTRTPTVVLDSPPPGR